MLHVLVEPLRHNERRVYSELMQQNITCEGVTAEGKQIGCNAPPPLQQSQQSVKVATFGLRHPDVTLAFFLLQRLLVYFLFSMATHPNSNNTVPFGLHTICLHCFCVCRQPDSYLRAIASVKSDLGCFADRGCWCFCLQVATIDASHSTSAPTVMCGDIDLRWGRFMSVSPRPAMT